MAVSAFGVEHLEFAKRDRSGQLAAGAGLAGGAAVLAHQAGGDLRRVAPARRVGGALRAVAAGDPDEFARHVRGAVSDAKKAAALRYGRTALGVTAAGLAGGAVLARQRRPEPGAPA